MQFFKYDHLPENLQPVARDVAVLAKELNEALPGNPEKTVGIRKLLEAKDCFVRSMLAGEVPRT